MPVRRMLACLALFAGTFVSTPALAGDGDLRQGPAALPPLPDAAYAAPAPIAGYSAEERGAWLAECRERMRGEDDGVGGAVIGGLIGGVAGNRIAGSGDRLVGTVVGAGVGAVAGAAIDRAEDSGRTADFCEDYLYRYENSYAGAGSPNGATQGEPFDPNVAPARPYPYYAGRVMWVPVRIGCRPKCDCKQERIVEEWIEEPAPARRVIRDKRIKLQPAKRSKYTKTQYSK